MNVRPISPCVVLAGVLWAGVCAAQGAAPTPAPATPSTPAPGTAASSPAAVTGAGTTVNPIAVSLACAGCHGTNGASAGISMPTLAGLPKEYLYAVMVKFKNGTRPSSIMGRLAKGYSDDDFKAMAAFFDGQHWVSTEEPSDGALAERGAKIHEDKCAVCHLDDGRYTEYTLPRLAGQWVDYLEVQMHEYKTHQPPMAQPKLMKKMLDQLSADDLGALAQFYAGQK